MENPCNELSQMLKAMPTYTSWATVDLEKLFIQYRAIILEMIESDEYVGYRWLTDYCPDLGKRIEDMLSETATDKQGRAFNNIAFELKCAMEVLTGALNCNNHEEWVVILANGLPKAA